ncbi:hypothetical protein D3C86_2059920 [compost metagenome]
MINTAIASHHRPTPHKITPATRPMPAAMAPTSARPLAANTAGASLPSTNMPRAPVPIGPSASQLEAAMLAWGNLCKAMRNKRMVRMLNATGTENAQST